MNITRRAVLKYGLGGAVLLAFGGVGLSLRETTMRRPGAALKVLDDRSWSILSAIADRMMPGGNGFPTASELNVPDKIDAMLATAHPAVVAEIIQLLSLFENALAGFVFDQRFQTFTASPPEVQDRVIEAWRSSRLTVRRTGYKALHGMIASSYYGSPETYKLVGYPGPPNYGNVRATPVTTAPLESAVISSPSQIDAAAPNGSSSPSRDAAAPGGTSSPTQPAPSPLAPGGSSPSRSTP